MNLEHIANLGRWAAMEKTGQRAVGKALAGAKPPKVPKPPKVERPGGPLRNRPILGPDGVPVTKAVSPGHPNSGKPGFQTIPPAGGAAGGATALPPGMRAGGAERPGGAYLPRRVGETLDQYKVRKASGGELDMKIDFPKMVAEGHPLFGTKTPGYIDAPGTPGAKPRKNYVERLPE
jgi:hypothetical protein